MDREGKQRVCMMVVHAGFLIEFDAILLKPFISDLLFDTVRGVIIQLCSEGRMSVHFCLFAPKQPHHGCARLRAPRHHSHPREGASAGIQGQGQRCGSLHKPPRQAEGLPAFPCYRSVFNADGTSNGI